MTAWMVRTGRGAAHPISGRRPTTASGGGVRPRSRVIPGGTGVLAGAAALLALAYGAGVGVASQETASGTTGGHGAHETLGGHGATTGRGGHGVHVADPSASAAAAVGGGSSWMRASGVFSPPGSFVPSDALTYDTRLVPAGARIEVTQVTGPSATRVGVRLHGFAPGRAYGMHAHTSPCGADPAAAGPHYQHRPSATADPVNEVWLDFRTDEDGDGRARAVHGWSFREGGARSVVIHDRQGGAGERAACFTVPFEPGGRA